jgi:hypothetical protein
VLRSKNAKSSPHLRKSVYLTYVRHPIYSLHLAEGEYDVFAIRGTKSWTLDETPQNWINPQKSPKIPKDPQRSRKIPQHPPKCREISVEKKLGDKTETETLAVRD